MRAPIWSTVLIAARFTPAIGRLSVAPTTQSWTTCSIIVTAKSFNGTQMFPALHPVATWISDTGGSNKFTYGTTGCLFYYTLLRYSMISQGVCDVNVQYIMQ